MKKKLDKKGKMNDYEKQIKESLSRPIKVSKQFENAIDTAFNKKDNKNRK